MKHGIDYRCIVVNLEKDSVRKLIYQGSSYFRAFNYWKGRWGIGDFFKNVIDRVNKLAAQLVVAHTNPRPRQTRCEPPDETPTPDSFANQRLSFNIFPRDVPAWVLPKLINSSFELCALLRRKLYRAGIDSNAVPNIFDKLNPF